ncbi:hypothetical protein I7I50_06232 [Histoplasma capsulatum G186AR]|uniref:Uncharacterized protein n=1 Tax=Ajellomyces capsulatus TaxID=5037 RepID=A0A8H8D444_AJECA|nr:hypothetical protein I7I52_10695 [Histoplasma capsulatum]QSS67219.1 hypothetical protein I7I50_06232 [Histoplasma capsulatum G186AR]
MYSAGKKEKKEKKSAMIDRWNWEKFPCLDCMHACFLCFEARIKRKGIKFNRQIGLDCTLSALALVWLAGPVVCCQQSAHYWSANEQLSLR